MTGPNGSGKSSLLRALCGFLPVQAGGFALEGGDPERTVGEQAHYLGHADALKGALTAGENLAFWAGALGGDSSPRGRRRGAGARRPRPCRSTFRCARSRPGRSGASRSRGFSSRTRPLWLLDEPTTALDAAAQAAFAAIMRAHLEPGRDRGRRDPCAARARDARRTAARGGGRGRGVRAARDRRPRPFPARMARSPGASAAARRSARCSFSSWSRSCPSRSGPDLNLLGAARAGDPVDRGAARDPARARPAVPGRSRRRLARRDDQRLAAARTRGAGQMRGALDGERAAADRRHAALRPDAGDGADSRSRSSPRRSPPARRRSP